MLILNEFGPIVPPANDNGLPWGPDADDVRAVLDAIARRRRRLGPTRRRARARRDLHLVRPGDGS